jgi:hypothetical protein
MQAPPPGTFKQFSVSDGHACAVRTDDTISCWGSGWSPGHYYQPTDKFQQVVASRMWGYYA